ncbi:MAG: hypothetical protein KKG59_03055 [Nanoarchaeota archaeon]|nr:hypothetical protein [Nanoarchaeota archaeon]
MQTAEAHAEKNGYGNIQEFIKETLREKLFEEKLTKKEADLIKKIIDISDKQNLYVSEAELFKKLRR